MKTIGLIFSPEKKQTIAQLERDPHGQIQAKTTTTAIKEALESKGYLVKMIPASTNLLKDIENNKPMDALFNICTGINNKREQANVIGMLELQDIPFLGSPLNTQILALHKSQTKTMFNSVGIPNPHFQVFLTGQETLDPTLKFPLIVKPESEGSSLGITEKSVVHNEEDLYLQVNHILKEFKQLVLVEEYLEGREFTIGLIGNKNPKILSIMEIKFHHDVIPMQTVQIKADNAMDRITPAPLLEEQVKFIQENAIKAYKALGCQDFARLDARMDKDENIYFIELNTLPGLQPEYSNYPVMATAQDISYEDLIDQLTQLTLQK